MRVPAFPIIASFALVAAPAFAQTSNMTGGRLSDDSTSSRLPPDTAVTLDTQQRLKQSLEQSGFKNVVVMPEAYIIHAKAPDGSKLSGNKPRSNASRYRADRELVSAFTARLDDCERTLPR